MSQIRNQATTVPAAAYGMFPENVGLRDVVSTLNKAGFGKKDICMVLSPAHPVAAVVRDSRIDDAQADTIVGTIGWVSEFGAVVIPTVGLFIRSQAFYRALMMEPEFPPHSGGLRTLVGLGFSENEATRLVRQLGKLGALVYVACPEGDKAVSAIELLRSIGASEVAAVQQVQQVKTAKAAA